MISVNPNSSSTNSSAHKECIFCSTKLLGHNLDPTPLRTADVMVKFLHYYSIPLGLSTSTYEIAKQYWKQYSSSSRIGSSPDQDLFQNMSYCPSCLQKVFEIGLAIEQFERLQELLTSLQQGVTDQLRGSLRTRSRLNKYRRSIIAELKSRLAQSVQANVGVNFKIDQTRTQAGSELEAESCYLDEIDQFSSKALKSGHEGYRNVIQDPTSAYVKLVRLELLQDDYQDEQLFQKQEILDPLQFNSAAAFGNTPDKLVIETIEIKQEPNDHIELELESDYDPNLEDPLADSDYCLSPEPQRKKRGRLGRPPNWAKHTAKRERNLKVKHHVSKAALKNKLVRDHLAINNIVKPLNLPCQFDSCTFIGKSHNLLESHISEEHIEEDKISLEDSEFICPKCGLQFPGSEENSIQQHSELHNKETTKYECKFCDKSFTFFQSLQAHFRNTHEDLHQQLRVEKFNVLKTKKTGKVYLKSTRYECKFCPFSFPHPAKLWSHLKKHHEALFQVNHGESTEKKAADFTCPFCSQSFPVSSSLWKHQIRHHTALVVRNTAQLPRRFSENLSRNLAKISATALEAEVENSAEVHVQPLICKYCQIPCPSAGKLWTHLIHHEFLFTKPEPQLPQIRLTSSSVEQSGSKEINVNPAKIWSYKCTFCPKSYRNFPSLRKHRIVSHTDEVTVTDKDKDSKLEAAHNCEQCAKSFPKCQPFLRHSAKCSKTFLCSECPATYKSKPNLDRHVSSRHAENLPATFKCDQCFRVLSSSDSLRAHIRVRHNKEFKHACVLCPFKSYHGSRLRYHIASAHTKEKNFLCTVCGRGYFKVHPYNVHMRLHTGEKPFTCQYCGKGFHSRGAWRRHVPLHGSERPFPCTLCGLRFPTRNNLDGHVRSHHRNQRCNVGIRPKRKSKYETLDDGQEDILNLQEASSSSK